MRLRSRKPYCVLCLLGYATFFPASADAAATGVSVTTETQPIFDIDTGNDTTTSLVSLGLTSASGNSKVRALVAASRLKVRRGNNLLSMRFTVSSFDSASGSHQDLEPSMRNAYGTVQYDRFLGKGFTVLWGTATRSDRFQGLLLRANLDAGFAYYFLDTRTQSLWMEGTFDYQHDWRRTDVLLRAEAKGVQLSRTHGQYGGRLSAAYEGQLGAGLSLATGLEYLQSTNETRAWRINWDLCLSSAVRDGLSLAVVYDLKYDHAPLPTVFRTDGLLTANLVYRLR